MKTFRTTLMEIKRQTPIAGVVLRFVLGVAASCLALAAHGSTVVFTFTNSVGQADTHPIKVYPLSVPTVGNSYSFVSKFALTLYPDATGTCQTNLMQGCYTVQNNFLGDGITFCVPNDTNTYPVGLLATDGFTVPTYASIVRGITSSDGSISVTQTNGQVYDLGLGSNSARGAILYDPVNADLSTTIQTNLETFWQGKSVGLNWLYFSGDGATPTNTAWTYGIDTTGLAAGTLNGQDDLALITRRHAITANHFWGGSIGDAVIFTAADGTRSTNYVQSFTQPVAGVDIELITLSNDVPANIKPFQILPSNAADYTPSGLPVLVFRNTVGGAGGPHINLQKIVTLDSNPPAQPVFDPSCPFYEGAVSSGDSGGPVFTVINGHSVFLFSIQATDARGPWVSYQPYLDAILAQLGSYAPTYADLSAYQSSIGNGPNLSPIQAGDLPVATALNSTDYLIAQKTGPRATEIIAMPDLLDSLMLLPNWPLSSNIIISGGGSNGLIDASQVVSGTLNDARLSSNIPKLDTSDTFSGPVTLSNSLTAYGSVQLNGSSITKKLTVSSDLFVGDSALTGGGRAIWLADTAKTNAILYTVDPIGNELRIYAGTNLNNWMAGGPSQPVSIKDGAIYADLRLSSNAIPSGAAGGGLSGTYPNPTIPVSTIQAMAPLFWGFTNSGVGQPFNAWLINTAQADGTNAYEIQIIQSDSTPDGQYFAFKMLSPFSNAQPATLTKRGDFQITGRFFSSSTASNSLGSDTFSTRFWGDGSHLTGIDVSSFATAATNSLAAYVRQIAVTNGYTPVMNFSSNVNIGGTLTVTSPATNRSTMPALVLTNLSTNSIVGTIGDQQLQSITVGSGLLYSNATLSATGGGGSGAGFPLSSDANGNSHAITNLSTIQVGAAEGSNWIGGSLTVGSSTNPLTSFTVQGTAGSNWLGGNTTVESNLTTKTFTTTGAATIGSTLTASAGVSVAGTLTLSGIPLANTVIGVDAGKQVINYAAGAGIDISGGSIKSRGVPQPIQSFASSTNALALTTNAYNQFFFVATQAVAITNATGLIDGMMTYADLIVSNSIATSITSYVTSASTKFIGQISTNALTIPAGKEGHYHFEARGTNEINVFNCLQQ